MKTTEFDFEVAIAGLGPTGLTLAHVLARRGHKVVVFEREPVFYGNARAVYTDDECMRILQSVGLADPVQEKMLQETPVQLVRPDGRPITQYRPLGRPMGWPVVNFFYQPYLETTMTDLLAAYPNVSLRRGREVAGFEQDDEGVTIHHEETREFRFREEDASTRTLGSLAPDRQSVRARYFIGADGGRSFVRESLGIGMTGRNFPEPWLVVDLKQKDPSRGLRHLPYFNFIVDPAMPAVSCVQPDGFHRFEFMVVEGMSREEMERPETVRRLMSKYVDPDEFEIKRKLVYTFNALMAETWRVGRVFLAGDAAHMTPQFMGQGASSGIRDGYNLGWKLSYVLSGRAGEGLLDSYQQERKDHAQAMIDVSVFLKEVVSMTNPLRTFLRDAVLHVTHALPVIRDYVQDSGFKPLPVYTRDKYFGTPRRSRKSLEGTLAPQPDVRLITGERERLDNVAGQDFCMIGFQCDPRIGLSAGDRQYLEKIGVKFLTLYRYGARPQGAAGVSRHLDTDLVEIEDLSGDMFRWFRRAGFGERGIVILRPDHFVFSALRADQVGIATDLLKSRLEAGGGRASREQASAQCAI